MKTRFDILNVITPFILVVIVLVLTLSKKKEAVSDLEKRKLAELPQFNLKKPYQSASTATLIPLPQPTLIEPLPSSALVSSSLPCTVVDTLK